MWSILFTLFLSCVSTQNSGCDFTQNVKVNKTYFVHSPNYPQYSTKIRCRWTATCPRGYSCKLECSDIDLTQSQGCTADRLMVAKDGDARFSSAQQYCGRGSLTATSSQRKLSIGLIATRKARIRCSLSAVDVQALQVDNCRCGGRKPITNRIVGGTPAVYEYPAMVAIADVRTHHIVCGGVVIDHRHVLTAAHCVGGHSVEGLTVVSGEDVANAISFASLGHKVKKFIIHPQYSSLTFNYDIAIIVLSEPLSFNDHLDPVCLPFKFAKDDMAGKNLTILGWGTLFPGGPRSETLLETSVTVVSQGRCRNVTASVTDTHICTYAPGKDACQGDSGGPLLYTESGSVYAMGVVSHGHSCASRRPAVNAGVAAVLPWIVNTTRVDYCTK